MCKRKIIFQTMQNFRRSSKDIPFEFPAPPDSTKKPKDDAFQIQRPKQEDDKEQVQRRDDFNFVEPKSVSHL